ncbi:MAG: putative Ig domain-containing protein [Terriglobales bacterium]
MGPKTSLILVLLAAALGAAAWAQGPTLSVPSLIEPGQQGHAYTDGNRSDGLTGGAVVNIVGGTAPYTCTLASGALPAGMSLTSMAATPISFPDGLCLVTGTPTADGDFGFTVEVTDAGSNSAEQATSLVIFAPQADLPQLSIPVATAVSGGTSETITWTTNIPASTRVCWNVGYSVNTCSPVEDTAGVTSHSYTITGLVPSWQYQYLAISRGIAGGAPQDYLDNYDGGCCYNDVFSTAVENVSGTPTMAFSVLGGTRVVASYPLYEEITYWPINNGQGNTTAKFVVTGLPPSTEIHWPNLQDYGLDQGSVSTTSTTNDTFSIEGLSAISTTTVELLTNVGGTTPAGDYTVTVTGSVLSGGATVSSSTENWSVNVLTSMPFTPGSPASYPPIPALATWQNQMVGIGAGLGNEAYWYNQQQPGGACDWNSDEQGDLYYDGAAVDQQIASYTGDPVKWITGGNASPCPLLASTTAALVDGVNQGITAAGVHTVTPAAMTRITAGAKLEIAGASDVVTVTSVTSTTFTATFDRVQPAGFTIGIQNPSGPQGAAGALALYESYLVAENYHLQGFWTFGAGLYGACTEGDATACTYLHNFAHANKLPYDLAAEQVNVRETAYNLQLLRLDYDAGGATTLEEVQQDVDYSLGHIDNILSQSPSSFEESFYDGLMAQELCHYYEDPQTGNFSDARIPPAIKEFADHLWNDNWIPRDGDNGEFIYGVVRDGAAWVDEPMYDNDPMRPLNLLIAPLFAFVYHTTGNALYQREGDTIWYSGVETPTGNGIDWSAKNFNQQYRWSFDYVRWRGFGALPNSRRRGGRHGMIMTAPAARPVPRHRGRP